MKILKLQSDNKFLEKQNERILALFKKYQSEYKKELN